MALFSRTGPTATAAPAGPPAIPAAVTRLADRAAELRAANVSLEHLLRMAGRTPRATAGVTVNEDSARRSMAVWRCQHLLADIVAGLPMRQYEPAPAGSQGVRSEVDLSPFVQNPSRFLDDNHEWRYQLMLSALSDGNAYPFITEFDRLQQFAVHAEVLHPADVTVTRKHGALEPPRYHVGREEVERARIMHMRAFGPTPGTVMGLSPIAYASQTIGLNLASRDYGAKWYEDGGLPVSMLSSEQDINRTDIETAKQVYKDAIADDGLLVIGKQWKYQALNVNPRDALFLEAIGATGSDVCGFYGIPPELLGYAQSGSSVTYANREQRMLDLLVLTVQWHTRRVERLISRQVPGDQFVVIDVDDLLVADILTRHRVHDISIRNGMANRNERRRRDHLPPIVDSDEPGDEYLWPPGASSVAATESPAPPAPSGG